MHGAGARDRVRGAHHLVPCHHKSRDQLLEGPGHQFQYFCGRVPVVRVLHATRTLASETPHSTRMHTRRREYTHSDRWSLCAREPLQTAGPRRSPLRRMGPRMQRQLRGDGALASPRTKTRERPPVQHLQAKSTCRRPRERREGFRVLYTIVQPLAHRCASAGHLAGAQHFAPRAGPVVLGRTSCAYVRQSAAATPRAHRVGSSMSQDVRGRRVGARAPRPGNGAAAAPYVRLVHGRAAVHVSSIRNGAMARRALTAPAACRRCMARGSLAARVRVGAARACGAWQYRALRATRSRHRCACRTRTGACMPPP
jgi:hypothetical protein